MPQTVYDCYRLGFGEPVALSATTGEGLGDLFVALQPHVDGAAQRLREAAGMAPAEGPAAHLSGGAAGGAEGGGRRRDRMVERRGVGAEASVVEGVEGEEEEDGEEGAEGPRTDVLKLAIMGLPNAVGGAWGTWRGDGMTGRVRTWLMDGWMEKLLRRGSGWA